MPASTRYQEPKYQPNFINTLSEIIIAVAKQIGRKQILTGDCWQNKYLSERAITRLKAENFIPYWHHHIPCNDGGVAISQIMAGLINLRLS